MNSARAFADALRFMGYGATWFGDTAPITEAEFKDRFTLYPHSGWVPGEPIPPTPQPIGRGKYPKLAEVQKAMQMRASHDAA